jgi:hypothetical protein
MSFSFLYNPGFCDSTLAPIPGRSCHGVSCEALMRSAASFSACSTCVECYYTATIPCECEKMSIFGQHVIDTNQNHAHICDLPKEGCT